MTVVPLRVTSPIFVCVLHWSVAAGEAGGLHLPPRLSVMLVKTAEIAIIFMRFLLLPSVVHFPMDHHPWFCHYFLICKVVYSSATPRGGSAGIGSRPSRPNLGGGGIFRYPLARRLGGPQSRSVRQELNPDSSVDQPIAKLL